jgi:transcriptional regulator with XRE-family HTH domain
MSFGRHLRALRQGAGQSRTELARKVGLPVSTLRNWEGDRDFPSAQARLRLAEAPGMPVERFAEGVEAPAREGGETTRNHGRRGKRPAALDPVGAHPRRGSTSCRPRGATGPAAAGFSGNGPRGVEKAGRPNPFAKRWTKSYKGAYRFTKATQRVQGRSWD